MRTTVTHQMCIEQVDSNYIVRWAKYQGNLYFFSSNDSVIGKLRTATVLAGGERALATIAYWMKDFRYLADYVIKI